MRTKILEAFTAYYNASSQLDAAQLAANYKTSPIPGVSLDNLLKVMGNKEASDKSVRFELDAIVFPLIDNTSGNEQLRFVQAMQKHVYGIPVEISKAESEPTKTATPASSIRL